jgi:hypothetical protein
MTEVSGNCVVRSTVNAITSVEIDEDSILNDIWTLYFHDPYNEDWTYGSYTKITDLTNVDEFWQLHSIINEKIHCGMFFVMREYIFPCWDDENNKNGGCLSIKVLKQEMAEFWEMLCIKLIGETLLKPEHMQYWNRINGISTSPKKYFCIIKIWVKGAEVSSVDMFNIPVKYHGDILYRSNQENIDNDNHRHIAPLSKEESTNTTTMFRHKS